MEDKSIYKEFGKRLKELRISKNITQVQMSNDLGISQTAVVQYESGSRKVPLSMLKKFANYFSLSLDELVDPENVLSSNKTPIDNIQIGINLKELREKKNISIDELAKEFDISKDDLNDYEKGIKPIPKHLLIKISERYNFDFENVKGMYITSKNEDLNRIIVAENPVILKAQERWINEVGLMNFTDEEMDELINFAKYLISKRK